MLDEVVDGPLPITERGCMLGRNICSTGGRDCDGLGVMWSPFSGHEQLQPATVLKAILIPFEKNIFRCQYLLGLSSCRGSSSTPLEEALALV